MPPAPEKCGHWWKIENLWDVKDFGKSSLFEKGWGSSYILIPKKGNLPAKGVLTFGHPHALYTPINRLTNK